MRHTFIALAGCAITLAGPALAQEMDPASELLQERVGEIVTGEQVHLVAGMIAAVHLIPELYERRAFRRAWTNPERVDELIGMVERSYEHGLDPEDYHLAEIRRLRAAIAADPTPDPELLADLDILLTDSLTRLGYHLYFGKVNPEDLDSNWNLSREFGGRDPVEVIQGAIDSESLPAYVAAFLPNHPVYLALKATLAEYHEIGEQGGWPEVPEGPTLKPGMEDPRVAVLRRRLRAEGDFEGADPANPNVFDAALEQAVTRFQDEHRLDKDGAVGPQTLAAMNVPVEERINQIRVNLERSRWVLRNVSDNFIVVNIAGFRAYLVKDGEIVWSTRAQVGKPYRMSPVFVSQMKYLVFNPTWTVPPGILRKDMLPKLAKDPGYLQTKDMMVLDQDGKEIDPTTLDWEAYAARRKGFPYMLRQRPGPKNALGRVKFIFPNSHFVYLHDTPSKALFERTDRTFSSGCIRIQNPFDLAELLLDNPEKWDQEAMQRTLDTKKTKTVFLPEPVTVMILYWTVAVEEQGIVRFLRDVYKRDARILAALDGDFTFELPQDLQESLGIPAGD